MFVFIADQERFSTDLASGLLGKSVGPLVSGNAIETEISEVVISCPVLKRERVKNSTYLNFDSW